MGLEGLRDGFEREKDNYGNNNAFEESNKKAYDELNNIKRKLEKLKSRINQDKLKTFSDEKLEEFLKEFKCEYKAFDKWGNIYQDIEIKDIESFAGKLTPIIGLKIEIQALISRIANKIHNEKMTRAKELLDVSVSTYNEIKEENIRNKESTLTISSLIFTAFTLIQLNFVAFQNSNSYSVLDRVILFSGINLFLVIGVYCILCMIKSFFSLKIENENERKLFKEIIVVIGVFSAIFIFSLVYKGCIEKTDKNYSNDIKLLNESLEKYKVENQIANLKLKELEEKLQLYKIEQLKLENKYKKLRQRVIKSNSTKTN